MAARRRISGVVSKLGAGALRALGRRTIPPRRGRERLPGLMAPVDVRHDAFAVPHIEARSDADLFRAQGALHARERFFQMDMLRRVLRGRLAETIGERHLPAGSGLPFAGGGTTTTADHVMRALDLVPAAKRVWARGDADGRALLMAYVEGVNAMLPALRRAKPLEHRLLRLPLRKWSPIDSLLLAKGMALSLSFKWRSAPVFAAIAERLGARQSHLDMLMPETPGLAQDAHARLVDGDAEGQFGYLPYGAPPVGSNAWLVGGQRSASGAPLLANDPHLELRIPSVWYLSSLLGGRYRAVGATLPGLPGVVIGRTPSVAWGLTNGMVDDADLWVEHLDDGEHHYRLDDAWAPLPFETQRIERRGRAPKLIQVRRTHRGPVFSDSWPGHVGPPLSLRLTLHEPTKDLETFLALGRARTVDEALSAADTFGSPGQNLLVADRDGAAAFRLIGRVPLRDSAWHPVMPRDGKTRASDWLGYVPQAEMPACRVAGDDVFVSANQAHSVDGRAPYVSHLYEPDFRAARIRERLHASDELDAEKMGAIQMDVLDRLVPWVRVHILEVHAEEVRRTRPALVPALDRLLGFDGREHVEARGAPLWHLFFHHLVRRTFSPVLGPELTNAWIRLINMLETPLRRAFTETDSPWAPPNVRPTLVAGALEDAVAGLRHAGLGSDAPWGAWHTLRLGHALGSVPPLRAFFDRGPMPVAGGPFTVSSGQYSHTNPGPMVVGASYRQVVDLADAQRHSGMVTLGGQSGHAASRHYDDLTPLWLSGERLPMRLGTPPRDPTPLVFEP